MKSELVGAASHAKSFPQGSRTSLTVLLMGCLVWIDIDLEMILAVSASFNLARIIAGDRQCIYVLS